MNNFFQIIQFTHYTTISIINNTMKFFQERYTTPSRKEEESRAKKERQKIIKSTQKEHARRCKTLLRDIISDTHKRQLFIINHGKKLLEAIPSIKEDLRILLRNPSEEIEEFIKSTVIVEEGDYSKKKETVAVSHSNVINAILAGSED